MRVLISIPSYTLVEQPLHDGSIQQPTGVASGSSILTGSQTRSQLLLPVPKDNQKLTRSQRLFSTITGIPPQSLSINDGEEFFLFMDMRAELGWVSFNMTPLKYVEATAEYNARLEARRKTPYGQLTKKNPRALMEKLTTIEEKVMTRIANKDFKCMSSPSTDQAIHSQHHSCSKGLRKRDVLAPPLFCRILGYRGIEFRRK